MEEASVRASPWKAHLYADRHRRLYWFRFLIEGQNRFEDLAALSIWKLIASSKH